MRLQWNGHRRLRVACADERKRVKLFRDFVGRSGFHNRASASGVTAKPDLSNQTGRVEATYHLELRLPEVCGSRSFRLIGMPGEQGHELHFDRSLSCEASNAAEQHYFGAYCISPLPKDQSSRAESTRLIQISSFRTFPFSCISSAILL